jgi:FkbM family methyltransferase
MFNNDNEKTNGELRFIESIKNDIDVIFDVGCRSNSLFTSMDKIVHYFDPVESFINDLSKQSNNNKISIFNNFGLGNKNEEKYYYPSVESFNSREISVPKLNYNNKVKLQIRKGIDYIEEKNIENIDFLKIDTEGYDFEVIKGFGEAIKNIQIIQFEYGGTSLDENGFKLNDIIKYLEEKDFHNFSYLHHGGYTKIKDLKGQTVETSISHRNGVLSSLSYPKRVEYIDDNGIIPDHYNYCNIVCFRND